MLVPVFISSVIFLGLLIYYLFYLAPRLNPVNKALAFEEQKMFREAIFEYKKALDRNPKDFVIHYKLANIYLNQKEFDQAAIHLEEIVKIDKYNYEVEQLDVQKKLTRVYYYRDEIEKAFQTFIDILKLYPGDVESLYHVSFIILGQEEFDVAQKYFDRLSRLKPDDFEVQFGAGICSYQNQKISNAIECFKIALSIKPNSEVANLSIAFAFYKKRDYKEAIIHLNKLFDSPIDIEVAFIAKRLSAFAHMQSKRYDQGIQLFEELLEIARSNDMEEEIPLALYDIGFACVSAERTKHAYEYWSELYQINRSYKQIDSLVTVLRKEMDVDFKHLRDSFDISVADYVDDWAKDAFPQDFLWDICGLKSDKVIDVKHAMVIARVSATKDALGSDITYSTDIRELIDKFCSLDTESFRIIANRIVEKLGYKVDQILQTYRESDGVDFLTISIEDKERTLVSVRRWAKMKVGEIPIRNFAQAINDMKVNHGLFVTTSELTDPAESSLKKLSKVRVIYPNQVGELLIGLI
jgi:tetratricopeptide (TPR) repeat protein